MRHLCLLLTFIGPACAWVFPFVHLLTRAYGPHMCIFMLVCVCMCLKWAWIGIVLYERPCYTQHYLVKTLSFHWSQGTPLPPLMFPPHPHQCQPVFTGADGLWVSAPTLSPHGPLGSLAKPLWLLFKGAAWPRGRTQGPAQVKNLHPQCRLDSLSGVH